MSEYTPGPWEASSLGIWAKSPWNARVCIAQVHNFSPMNKIDSGANARLLAAAPELLDALTDAAFALGTLGVLFDPGNPARDEMQKAKERIRAVIDKATNG